MRFLSGIQATAGSLHLGNYIGAVRQWARLSRSMLLSKDPNQRDEDTIKIESVHFMICDLHALTTVKDPQMLKQNTLSMFKSLVACGISPQHLFIQSAVPYHTQLHWILSTLAPLSHLTRMTQYKSKVRQTQNQSRHQDSKSKIDGHNAGLLMYPVLQAADIMLYQASHVPVGEDQLQHLELTRTLITSFNTQFQSAFPLPQAYDSSINSTQRVHIQNNIGNRLPRIMCLQNPDSKMSKSSPKGCLFITDSDEEIQRKILKARTDSLEFDTRLMPGELLHTQDRPGIKNLVDIALYLNSTLPCLNVEMFLQSVELRNTKQLKEYVGSLIIEHLMPIRERYKQVEGVDIQKLIQEGNQNALQVAQKNYQQIAQLVGLHKVSY
ncbi:hypothetical protein MIR68_002261 [Amoeboaphelidium protococcarum]|nr:hypothetical protein MIR68_002261 [Amoeboaphelidium protococcarum]